MPHASLRACTSKFAMSSPSIDARYSRISRNAASNAALFAAEPSEDVTAAIESGEYPVLIDEMICSGFGAG